ncbi:Proteinaceous RNase P 1, chloroplastic/mitochondrial [Vitis vinifera]|uniref:Proteinaceous RNase P 1, chloroplastic/mitochondrial n=1 Tax=Vitis vinifera TaxID=29760 RepID=A0A438BYR9_VITVI|nr:Proteinaceous RNase P 1, chloroplastic/mitochondrial [Vitis vinifera]
MCSKRGDVVEALRLYDEARSRGVPLSQHHYNVLFKWVLMGLSLTRLHLLVRARLACAMEDLEMAFNLVKQMKSCGIPPKLRSYGPPLFGFCKKGDADRAYEVDAHMMESVWLLKNLSSVLSLGLVWSRGGWTGYAAGVGEENWDVGKVREGVVKGGGGWHGQGWLGKGKWKVVRTEMDEAGVCQSCGEKLVCIDIDPRETENFASSLTKLACQREVKADFVQFQVSNEVISSSTFGSFQPQAPLNG